VSPTAYLGIVCFVVIDLSIIAVALVVKILEMRRRKLPLVYIIYNLAPSLFEKRIKRSSAQKTYASSKSAHDHPPPLATSIEEGTGVTDAPNSSSDINVDLIIPSVDTAKVSFLPNRML
jgi:hypothetical protein